MPLVGQVDEYIFIVRRGVTVHPSANALHRMRQVARMTGASVVYSDYYERRDGSSTAAVAECFVTILISGI